MTMNVAATFFAVFFFIAVFLLCSGCALDVWGDHRNVRQGLGQTCYRVAGWFLNTALVCIALAALSIASGLIISILETY